MGGNLLIARKEGQISQFCEQECRRRAAEGQSQPIDRLMVREKRSYSLQLLLGGQVQEQTRLARLRYFNVTSFSTNSE